LRKSNPISKEDFDSWKINPITLALIAHMSTVKSQIHERWAGFLSGEVPLDPNAMQLYQIEFTAKLAFIEDMLSLELSDIQEDNDAAPAT